MLPDLIAMQSKVRISQYDRPDRWLRSNTEFILLAGSGGVEPYLVIGVGPKSRGDEDAAPDDLSALHVMIGTRTGSGETGGAGVYLLNRYLPQDLEVPALFRTGQFFPADGVAELVFSDGLPSLSVLGRHAHRREDNGQILEVTERGMRCRVHIEGRVADVRAALAWQFTAERLPWGMKRIDGDATSSA